MFVNDWHAVSEMLHQILKSGFQVPEPVKKEPGTSPRAGYLQTRIPDTGLTCMDTRVQAFWNSINVPSLIVSEWVRLYRIAICYTKICYSKWAFCLKLLICKFFEQNHSLNGTCICLRCNNLLTLLWLQGSKSVNVDLLAKVYLVHT